MDEDILRGIQTVEYYYEQYKNGDEEAIIALEEIAKGIKNTTKVRTKYYILYRIFNFIQKTKAKLIDAELLENPQYQELLQFSQEDIEYYSYIGEYLQMYVNHVLSTNDFDNLDNAFMLSIKMSMILHNITEYYKEMNTMLEFANSSIQYVSYNTRAKELMNTTRNEMEALRKTLERKDSSQ